MSTPATISGTCTRCGAPASRPDLPGRFARLVRSIPLYCDACVEQIAAEDADRDAAAVQARVAQAVEDRVKRSGLPTRHHISLRGLEHPAEVLTAARHWVNHGGGLLLTGDIGAGKTTIAGAACWERLQTRPVTWITAPLLFARLGSGLGTDGRDQALDILAGRHGLVLDDIDKARPTEYAAEQVFLAIDQRVEHSAPLLITTNLTPGDLAARWPEPYGPAIASRLVGYCTVIPVPGGDRRIGDTP